MNPAPGASAWPTDDKAARSAEINRAIDALAPEFIIHVPSSTLTTILEHCEQLAATRMFPVTREEEGVGIAAGLALAKRRVLMIIQDNGLGNCLTALGTFPLAYHIPLLLLISRRGGLKEYNSMIHVFSEHVEGIAAAAGLRFFSLDGRTPIERWSSVVTDAYEFAQTTHRPVIVFCNLMAE